MLHARRLSALPGVRHAFFTRQGGVSQGIYASLNGGIGSRDAAAHVAENRELMAAAVGVRPENFLTPFQVHSPDVAVVDEPWPADVRPRADAIVTRVPRLAIGVSTADCGPVLFADAEARVIGAAHAGWRGAFTGVLENTVAAMEGLGARRNRIIAVLGPSIGPKNYEVGPEFLARFVEAGGANATYFAPSEKEGHAFFDLNRYTVDRLRKAGVLAEKLDRCTYAEEELFYSYRRTTHRNEPDYGRQVSAIVLEEN